MTSYDYVMAGGGMAALSLTYQILQNEPDARIAVIDPVEKGENDRTWSYWAKDPQPFDQIACCAWDRVSFCSNEWSAEIDIAPYRYYTIRSEDFYNTVLSVAENADVTFIRDRVEEYNEADDHVDVICGRGTVGGRWVFDSRFDPAEYVRRDGPYHYLKQHFLGWTLETDTPAFDPKCTTLFDFRLDRHEQFRFGYILPASDNRALIEYTLFTADLLEDSEYVVELEKYIRDVLGIREYRVVEKENGVIPMTDEPPVRKASDHVMNIGTRGGRVKPSTGYAFARTQKDSVAIAESLSQHGHPFSIPKDSTLRLLLDTMMLQVMHRRGEITDHVFANLFRKNPIDRLFRFLDEETTFWETIKVMATVPWGPFLTAFFRTKIKGDV